MTSPRKAGRRESAGAAPRVGLFGLLGVGNTGNDGSLEAVLRYLQREHPEAILDCLCSGPEQVAARYGLAASRWHWYHLDGRSALGMGPALKLLGLGVDAVRMASWVRQHDVVIVSGTGVLESLVPLRPWQTPCRMFVLSASGKLLGTKVALVSVGASVIRERLTRRLVTAAARLAYYRSFRDNVSRDAMRQMGLDTSADPIYPDLAFSLPTPEAGEGATGTVGVGVMDYRGANEDRRQADGLHAAYVAKMKRFVCWLVGNGHTVRLLTGDPHDEPTVQEILAGWRVGRPDLDPSSVVAEPVASLAEVMQQIISVDTVVATRFHNVVCALKLAKPTVSIGYATKHDALMADMGLSHFCQHVKSLDVDLLIEQFTELEGRSAELRETIADRNAAKAELVNRQFAELSAVLFPDSAAGQAVTGHKPARTGTR
jgi:polysaccharide pyruvyl transferase WcaK-like protein